MSKIANKEDLKGYFKDGALPSGENFATLIDSMVHVDEFGEWTQQGQISLGAGESKWQLHVDKNEDLLIERRPKEGQPAGDAPTASSVRMSAWVAMEGRIGTYAPERSSSGASTPSVNTASMNSVSADGNWHPIMDVPHSCQAFEIVAQMTGPQQPAEVGIFQLLRRWVGLARPDRAITHAIVMTSASGSCPSIRQTADPDPSGAWRRLSRGLLVIVLLLLVGLLPLSLFPYTSVFAEQLFQRYGLDPTSVVDAMSKIITPMLQKYEAIVRAIQAHSGIARFVGILFVLYLVTRVLSALQIHRTGVRLAWKKKGGSVLKGKASYALHLRGGRYGRDTDVKIHYHVTQLWR